jgi:hypothetical protein
MIAAYQLADFGWLSDVGGCEAEHLDDGVAGSRRQGGGVFAQAVGDVLAEIFG